MIYIVSRLAEVVADIGFAFGFVRGWSVLPVTGMLDVQKVAVESLLNRLFGLSDILVSAFGAADEIYQVIGFACIHLWDYVWVTCGEAADFSCFVELGAIWAVCVRTAFSFFYGFVYLLLRGES